MCCTAHQLTEMIKSENGFRGSPKISLGEGKGRVAPNKQRKGVLAKKRKKTA